MKKDLKHYTEKFEYYSLYLQQAINSIGLSYQGKKVDLVHDVYISLLNRIGINITSIHHLSKIFIEENVSSSIALLLRACISDMVLGYYLFDLSNDIKTFEGEIKIKDAEFLRYIQKVSTIEQRLLSHKNENSKIQINDLVINEFDYLIDHIDKSGDFVIKSNSSIRNVCGSDSKLLRVKFDGKVTEEKMFNLLREQQSPMGEVFDNIYTLWKYYSQFQHYTFYGRVLIKDKKENFLYYFIESLFEIYNFLSVMQKFVFEISIVDYNQNKEDLKLVFEEFKPDQLE